MASAYRCDRCGVFVSRSIGLTTLDVNTFNGPYSIVSIHNKYDLCSECKDELYKFLKNKKENQNESSHT